jgi:hypothetical protein
MERHTRMRGLKIAGLWILFSTPYVLGIYLTLQESIALLCQK